VETIAEVCDALTRGDVAGAGDLVERRYPLATRREAQASDALMRGDIGGVGDLVEQRYPLATRRKARASISKLDSVQVFLKDGFVDRYSGARLVFPPVLRVISEVLPEQFPYHKNWKFGVGHTAYWELQPTVDHVVPVARGGAHDMTNWVSTSMLRNRVKGHWTLDELGWKLVSPGRLEEWDGLLGWFMEYGEHNPRILHQEAIRSWHRSATPALKMLKEE
jgi:hypothetical protein